MSAFTSLVIGLIGGILLGLALQILRPNTDSSRVESYRALVASYQGKAVAQGGQLRECTDRLATLRELSVFDALAGEVKP